MGLFRKPNTRDTISRAEHEYSLNVYREWVKSLREQIHELTLALERTSPPLQVVPGASLWSASGQASLEAIEEPEEPETKTAESEPDITTLTFPTASEMVKRGL